MKSNRNALVHGVYSSDIIMPWERPEDFDALLNGIRRDFKPRGTTEDDIVFDIAVLHWRKRRVNWLLQFEFVDAQFAGEVEKSGKRSVDDIRRSIETRRVKKGREKVKYTSAVVGLSEAVTSLAYELKKNTSLGKLGANMRSVVDDIEKLRPIIEAGAKSVDEAKKIDGACNLDTIGSACELEARLDALIDKKIQRLIVIREFQRQYGQDSQDSNVKLIEHHSHGSAAEKAVAKEGGRKTSTKKSMDINDNWNDNNNDNDNDNDNNNEDNYDWEHEYDQALAEQKKGRPKRRAARD